MRLSIRFLYLGFGLAVACGQAPAQSVDQVQWKVCPAPIVPQPGCQQMPGLVPQPVQPAPMPAPAPTPSPAPAPTPSPTPAAPETPPEVNFNEARAGAGLGESFAMAAPMLGDFAAFSSRRTIVVPNNSPLQNRQVSSSSSSSSFLSSSSSFLSSSPSSSSRLPSGFREVIVNAPVTSRSGSGFKLADYVAALPTDNVFITYNYFSNLSSPNSVANGMTIPGVSQNLNQEMFGFEKTFLDGNASIGLRVPFEQAESGDTPSNSDVGDLSVVLKYAFINDRSTGNGWSAGLVVTAPTGQGIATVNGTIRDTLIQPFTGAVWNSGNFFVQGFSSIVVPTDSTDITIWFNDLEVGYIAYRCREGLITSVAPVLEGHVTTPLNHRNNSDLIFVPDLFSLTAGVHIGLGERSLFSLGVNVPLTGPEPYDVEALAQFKFFF